MVDKKNNIRIKKMTDKKNNTGDYNTGDYNTGYCNTGYCNTGNRNTGNRNTGNRNTGYCNTGDYNTGNRNTGDCNTGNRNTGYWNTGYWNTGIHNTGDYNTGNCNTGNCNTGIHNTGDWNTGNRNTGIRNTGDWNTGDWNTGYCNTVTPEDILVFNRPTTRKEWNNTSKPTWMYVSLTKWISESDMSDKEKDAFPTYVTTGGYLKSYTSMHHAYIEAWEQADEDDRVKTFKLPNFDAEVFEEIFGFNPLKEVKKIITIDGKDIEITLESFNEIKKTNYKRGKIIMHPNHPLNKNVIYLTKGHHLKIKHLLGAAIALTLFSALYVAIVP